MIRGEYAARLSELEAKALYKIVASIIPSTTASNTYDWLSKFPKMRKWVGDRVINSMKEQVYQILNELHESTLGIARTDIEDDNIGQYRILSKAQADEVESFRNRLIAALLSGGFSGLCFDGQYFFDMDHPVYPNADGTGVAVSTSNIQGDAAATGTPWYLLCLSGALKPFILQERTKPEMESIEDPKNAHVFIKDEYLYGIRYRANAGYGFWQLAVGSKDTLNAANYEAARLKMMSYKRDGGDPLGIVPTHLLVPPTLEAAGRAILEKELLADDGSNTNFHTAELIVNPWVS